MRWKGRLYSCGTASSPSLQRRLTATGLSSDYACALANVSNKIRSFVSRRSCGLEQRSSCYSNLQRYVLTASYWRSRAVVPNPVLLLPVL